MSVGRINKIGPFANLAQIIDAGKRPSNIIDTPVPKVRDVLNLQEQVQQAEVDANLACAFMKSQHDILMIIINGI